MALGSGMRLNGMIEASLRNKKLVFIVGSPRSGTTWLRMLLSQSPRVVTTRATHLYSDYFRSFIDSRTRFAGLEAGLNGLVTDAEADQWIREFSTLCFDRAAAQRPDATVIVEKTPGHSTCGADILRLFPNSAFIHVVRDPRAVVVSLRAASRSWGASWAPGQLVDACEMWKSHVDQAQRIADLTTRYCEVIYERLHEDGVGEILRLFEWLGEPITHDVAASYVEACAFNKVRPDTAALSKKKADKRFFRQGKPDGWRGELTPTEIAAVEHLAGKPMRFFGYEPVARRRERAVALVRLRASGVARLLEGASKRVADELAP